MIATYNQILTIIKTNPQKKLIDRGRKMNNQLMLHLYGKGLKDSIKNCAYFVSPELHKVQQEYAVSNKDMFGRLLQQEDLIFTARGGGQYFGMNKDNEAKMNALLDDVVYDQSLRKWIRNFALPAYRSDPMGIIFMEKTALEVPEVGEMQEPNVYPTYKSIWSIYDYLAEGRELEYVCFKLTVAECLSFGVQDLAFNDAPADGPTDYYRFVDDKVDNIYKYTSSEGVTALAEVNVMDHGFSETPGFIVSDMMKFDEPACFSSPLDLTIELADSFLYDRSVRDLQKKYHGFAKAIEPLLKCSTCEGTGQLGGYTCPECTPAGATKGTGYKLKTKVSDVARFPMSLFENGNFDFQKVFGYVSPDIKGWEKQDMSLTDLEELIEMTYWGTVRMKRPQPGANGNDKTATEVDSNNQPKYARLNMTADWAERTEKMIADFIGEYWFQGSYKSASISYGRNYVLETPEEIMATYQVMRTKGAPDFTLDEQLQKYYNSLYQNNPFQLDKCLKLLRIEPFPHISIVQAKAVIPDPTDYMCKVYFGEWYSAIPDVTLITTADVALRKQLKDYVKAKKIVYPEPVVTVAESVRTS